MNNHVIESFDDLLSAAFVVLSSRFQFYIALFVPSAYLNRHIENSYFHRL